MAKINSDEGFTLVELMISVGIVGILAGIAYPSYQKQVQTSRRADAQVALMDFANTLERRYTETNTYVPDEPDQDKHIGHYTLRVTTTTSSYTLEAIPDDSSDSCGTLRLDNLGQKTSDTSQAGCW